MCIRDRRIDARELDEFFRFDRILLDAPCTGTGTVISGNEKSLRGLTGQLLSKCARSQRALLDRAMGALKPGGTLVYSTCSILPQENEDALQEALDKMCIRDRLEATEDAVRERTRDSRIKFTGAIVCIVAAILVIILVWLFASK